jgi:hypothetical protein
MFWVFHVVRDYAHTLRVCLRNLRLQLLHAALRITMPPVGLPSCCLVVRRVGPASSIPLQIGHGSAIAVSRPIITVFRIIGTSHGGACYSFRTAIAKRAFAPVR